MVKPLYFLATLVIIISSCKSYKMIEGKSKPVYFLPDNSVFINQEPNPTIAYTDLYKIRGYFGNGVTLQKGKTATAIIQQPTFFFVFDDFLVYPGEHLIIKKGEMNDYVFLKERGNKRRNRELAFFKDFHKIEHYPFIPKLYNATLDSILTFEKQLKIDIPSLIISNRKSFDSLLTNCKVSRKFKRLSKYYLNNKYAAHMFFLYSTYKDTLEAHGLFKEKCNELVPLFNNITEKSEFENTFTVFNELVRIVLPYTIWKINVETEFQTCFDSVLGRFTGVARDNLLSQLMYYAYKKRIPVSNEYLNKYKIYCKEETYKKLVGNVISQQQRIDSISDLTSGNSLLALDGMKISSMEDVLKKHKGKLILIDFWASWCAPCMKEIPYLSTLQKELPGDSIAFLSISMDSEIQPWQKSVVAGNVNIVNSYLLVNASQSAFVKAYNIQTIPRFILIGKNGKIINPDAPKPSDPKLKSLLNKLL